MSAETTVITLTENDIGTCVQRVINESGETITGQPVGRVIRLDASNVYFANPNGNPKEPVFIHNIKSKYIGKYCAAPPLSGGRHRRGKKTRRNKNKKNKKSRRNKH